MENFSSKNLKKEPGDYKEMRRCPACAGSGVVITGENGYHILVSQINKLKVKMNK